VGRNRSLQATSLWIASIGIALGVGTLAVVKSIQPDPEALQAELRAKLAAIERDSPGDPIGQDQNAEELLAVDSYRDYALGLYRRLERLHGRLHERATLQREAVREVPPVLKRLRAAGGADRREAEELWDRVQSLLSRYSESSFGPALTRERDLLRDRLATLPSPGDRLREWVEVTRKARALSQKGDHAGALRLVQEFEDRLGTVDDPGLARQISEFRASLARAAETAARRGIEMPQEPRQAGSSGEPAASPRRP